MRLFVVRHGQAEHHHPEGDAQRTLTAAGLREADAVGRFVRRRASSVARIVHSPFVRTTQTAVAVAVHVAVPVDPEARLASGAPVEEALAVVAEQPPATDLLLVGHQPTLGRLVRLLTGARAAIAPASVAVIDLPRPASTAGVLVGLYEPRWLPTG